MGRAFGHVIANILGPTGYMAQDTLNGISLLWVGAAVVAGAIFLIWRDVTKREQEWSQWFLLRDLERRR